MIAPLALIAARCSVRQLGIEVAPEGEVEVLIRLHIDLLARSEHAGPAEIVEHRIGAHLRALRIVEADIGGDLRTRDRLEQIDDDDRDARLCGSRQGRPDDLDLGRRDGDDVDPPGIMSSMMADLIAERRVGGGRPRHDLDCEPALVGFLRRLLEEARRSREDTCHIRRYPADRDFRRVLRRGRSKESGSKSHASQHAASEWSHWVSFPDPGQMAVFCGSPALHLARPMARLK